MILKITGIQISSYTQNQRMPTLQELADNLCDDNEIEYVIKKQKDLASIEKIDVTGVNSIFTKIKKYPYEFEIDTNLRLAAIDGVKLAENGTVDEELKLAVEELKTNVKDLQEENKTLKQSNEELRNRITILENETICNKRVRLTDNSIEVPLTTTSGWQDKDCGTLKLTNSIEGYKYLEIQTETKNTNNVYGTNKTILINVEGLKYYDSNTNNYTTGAEILLESICADVSSGLCVWFRNSSLLQIGAIWNNSGANKSIRIKAIYGIK